jgi:RNA polymerase sigma-70 factor, ECF subfamily
MDVGRGSGQREAALQELHDRHASELWRFAMRRTRDRQLSEDIVQEVLLRAWKDPSLGSAIKPQPAPGSSQPHAT